MSYWDHGYQISAELKLKVSKVSILGIYAAAEGQSYVQL